MLRLIAASAVAVITLLLGGCAMESPSRLDEYRTEAEGLSADVLALVPPALRNADADTMSKARFGDTSAAAPRPGDSAWWEVRTYAELALEPEASRAAAAAISDGLKADGWTEDRVRETNGGARITDGYRDEIDGEDWYIEVTSVVTRPGQVETLLITVVSPQTTRGEQP